MKYFKQYARQDVLAHTRFRKFETKIGERVRVPVSKIDLREAIAGTTSRFILFGIPEDIGVRANYGTGGTDTAWPAFLQSFLNVQSNDFFSGEEVLLIGHFDFNEVKFLIEENAYDVEEKTDAYRHAVTTIDEAVESLAMMIAAAGKIAIAVGGGHNNAYPLIKGTAKGLQKAKATPLAKVNCINLDAHTDFRASEGRHSGNAFRYAEEDGYLDKYAIIGAHENYITQNVWLDIVNNPRIDITTFEDIFVREKLNFMQAIIRAASFARGNRTVLELDLDCMENVLASAATPSGISTLQARQFMHIITTHTDPAYLHICEGAALLSDGRSNDTTGKLISYLISDFIKGFH